MMRAVLIIVMSILGIGSASAETWMSRTGLCFEWEGRWEVNRDPNGMWVGDIEFIQIGGRCVNPTHQVVNYSVKAVIVGEEFFGVRGSCHMNGRLRGDTIRGVEVCAGSADQFPIVIHLTPDGR
jgi:hypothetical protein